MWPCSEDTATRSPPCAPESRVRGLDVRAELGNHLARNWEVSECVAVWQREEQQLWGHGPGTMEGTRSPCLSHGTLLKSSVPGRTVIQATVFWQDMLVWVKIRFFGSWLGAACPCSSGWWVWDGGDSCSPPLGFSPLRD